MGSLAEQFASEHGIQPNPEGALSGRQDRFCIAYFETGNAVEAYRLAYGTQAKRSTVAAKAYRLLSEPKVRRRVAELRARAADDALVSVALVLQELGRIALFDPRSIVGEHGALLPLDEMPSDVAAAIASIEVEEVFAEDATGTKLVGYTKKVRFWNKVDALDKAMKHLGLYGQNNRQKASIWDQIPRSTLLEIQQRLTALVHKP